MILSLNDLSDLMTATWVGAQENSYELKNQVIEEILVSFQTKREKPWKVLKFEEWLGLPSGKKVFHKLFGEGFINIKAGSRFVSFRGFSMDLNEAGWPWDKPVQLL